MPKYGHYFIIHVGPRMLKKVIGDMAKALIEQAIRSAEAVKGADVVPHKIEILISIRPGKRKGFNVGWKSDFEPAGYTLDEDFTDKEQRGEVEPDA